MMTLPTDGVALIVDLRITAIYLAIAGAIFCVGEGLKRLSVSWHFSGSNFDNVEVARKFAHVGCGAFVAAMPYLGGTCLSGLGLGGVVLAALPCVRRAAGTGGFLGYLFARRSGTMAFAAAVAAMSALFFDKKALFAASFMVLALADPAAAWIGMRYGRTPFLNKSLQGFLAHLAVATAVLTIFFATALGMPLVLALGAAAGAGLVLSLVESLLMGGLDNLAIPLATGGVLSFAAWVQSTWNIWH